MILRRCILCTTLLFLNLSLLRAVTLNAPAPPFTLTNLRHQKRSLSDYKGKIVFINFWASWCAPCQVELPELDKLAADYAGKKVRVLTINVDTDRAAANQLLARLRLQHPHFEILWDTRSKVVSRYKIETMPSSYILDAQGVIRFSHSGFHQQDPATWRDEINGLRIDR